MPESAAAEAPAPLSSSSPPSAAFTPSQIRTAYGINSIQLGSLVGDGSGQTIAIIDAYDDPNVLTDLQAFSAQFSLPGFNGTGQPTFQKLDENGNPITYPTSVPASGTSGWALEESLDVEWAHAVAPMANLILIETVGPYESDMLTTAVNTARKLPGVSVVSMSFGEGESSSEGSYDGTFATPGGHEGVTFVASTGDSGSPGEYPAASPNVLAVGGTTLKLNADNTYQSEIGWSGSGGGQSPYEAEPAYQYWVQSPELRPASNPGRGLRRQPQHGRGGARFLRLRFYYPLGPGRRHQPCRPLLGRPDRYRRPAPRVERLGHPGRALADPAQALPRCPRPISTTSPAAATGHTRPAPATIWSRAAGVPWPISSSSI